MIRVRHRLSPLLLVGLAAGAACVTPLRAEDTKGKWQFGFGLSYMATTDYIRSNSDIAIAGTTAGEVAGLPSVTAVDERPDDNMLNEPSVRDDFRFDFNASYGITRWLALELAAGYMKSDVGNIEYFFKDQTTFYAGIGGAPSNVCGPNRNAPCYRYNTNTPASPATNSFVQVGTLTEIPLQLSGLVRFRPESPLDPYVGLGIGYLFTDLTTADEFNERGQTIAGLNVGTELKGEYTNTSARPNRQSDIGFQVGPMQAEVSSDYSWHAVGGIDYFVNDHFSVYVDARYTWTDASVNITVDGAHQVLLTTNEPGKLQTVRVDSGTQWEDHGLGCVGCDPGFAGDHFIATEDSNGNGTFDHPPEVGQGTEGLGKLYFFPAGPNPNDPDCFTEPAFESAAACTWTEADAIAGVGGAHMIDCTNNAVCPWRDNSTFDTEDINGNRILDRFLYYGVDVCTLPGAETNPVCRPTDIDLSSVHFVWPGNNCTPNTKDPVQGQYHFEGCPPSNSDSTTVSSAGSDDSHDTYLVQGGDIKLGGFSIGLGFKITF
jgi:outer membrane protein W